MSLEDKGVERLQGSFQAKAWRNERQGVFREQWWAFGLADGILGPSGALWQDQSFRMCCLTFLNFSFLIYRMEKILCCPRDCGEDKITSIRESY